MKPYEYVITYSIQNHQKIIKIRRSFCVQEIRLKINTGDNTALKLGMILCIHSLYFSCCSFWSFMGFFSLISGELHSCFLPCSGSLVDKSAFNQQHHTHQAAAGILQDCTGEVWGVGNTLHRQIALQTDITVVA